MEIQDVRKFAREVTALLRQVEELRSLLKTPGGHLKDVGVATIRDAVNGGMTQTKVASLLGISSAAVSRRMKA